MQHELKCWPEYYTCAVNGSKPFEIRKDDRGFKVGDTLLLHEWDPTFNQYSGYAVRVEVTYILRSHPGLATGYAILGTRLV